MRVLAVTATCGRHHCIERIVRMFLMQDYHREHSLLIYNNSPVPQTIGVYNTPENKRIYLANNHLSTVNGQPYINLGQIYRDALSFAPSYFDAITFMDDDDLYLPNHITEGIRGLQRAKEQGKLAYKPQYSWYRHAEGCERMNNTLEPSIFADYQHVINTGFGMNTTAQHLHWLEPLIASGRILVEENGISTLIYNWGDNFFTYKTSGNANHPMNFERYRVYSKDHGDKIITPVPEEEITKIFEECLIPQSS